MEFMTTSGTVECMFCFKTAARMMERVHVSHWGSVVFGKRFGVLSGLPRRYSAIANPLCDVHCGLF